MDRIFQVILQDIVFNLVNLREPLPTTQAGRGIRPVRNGYSRLQQLRLHPAPMNVCRPKRAGRGEYPVPLGNG